MNLHQILQPGARKALGFLITLFLFTALVLTALLLTDVRSGDLPAFAFQLASAYGVLCGLFFGSNVLEHYSRREKP